MVNSFAEKVFEFFCHQNPERCWAPRGITLPVCQRCTGVYVGVLLALLTIIIIRSPVTRKLLVFHLVLVLQAIPFGLHFIPETPEIRLLSGQLFSVGIVYFLTAGLVENSRWKLPASCKNYIFATVLCLLFLQLVVRLPFPFAAAALNFSAVLGLVIFICLVIVNIISLKGLKKGR